MSTRVTYIHQHFRKPSEAGGTRSWEFARRLAAEGHTVTMICGGDTRQTYRESGFKVIQLPIAYSNSMSTARRIVSFLRFMVASSIAAMKTPSDVVFATSTPLTVAVPGMLAAATQRARFVLEVRDLWPSVPIALGILRNPVVIRAAKLLEKVAYGRSHAIIALSPSMSDGVREVAPQKHVHLAPNACDFDMFHVEDAIRREFRESQGWSGQTVFVYAGSFGLTYELESLVRLAAEFQDDPRVRFVLIGEGASTERCQELARTLEIDASSVLVGALPKRTAAMYVACADVVISSLYDAPALRGNSLNKVFDAMAAGRPVLFNHGGWLSDVLTSTGAGWAVPAGNLAKQIEVIRSLLDSPEAIRVAASQSHALGRARFSRDHVYQVFSEAVLSPKSRLLSTVRKGSQK